MSRIGRAYRGETHIDFLGKRRIWFALSAFLVLGSLLVLPLRPAESSCSPPLPGYFAGLSCGIEFKGGVSIQAPIAPDSDLADMSELQIVSAVRDRVAEAGALDVQVQVATQDGRRSVIVQTTELGDPEAQAQFQDAVREITGASVAEASPQSIGRKWGGEITRKAVRALFVFLIVVLAFISWRFEWKMALASIIAMVHDLIVTAGVYAVVGFEVTPSTVIAILTILGYSLYDTVVVFDKVEEDVAAYAATGRTTYQDAANRATNEVFMRSLNTSLSTLLPVGALLFIGAGFLGATTLQDLSLALLIGLLAGAYSSIFIAVPVLSMLKEKEPRYQKVRERLTRVGRDAGLSARPAAATGDGGSLALTEMEPARLSSEPRRPATTVPQAARPAAGSKKARRRRRR